jgi:hypothetical protein
MGAIITDNKGSTVYGHLSSKGFVDRLAKELDKAFKVEGDWGIKPGEWEPGGDWFHGPPDYTIVHCCPRTEKSDTTCLERWDMKTMHWVCEGCLTAPSDELITLWKIMGGHSLLWEAEVPEGTDLMKLDQEAYDRREKQK